MFGSRPAGQCLSSRRHGGSKTGRSTPPSSNSTAEPMAATGRFSGWVSTPPATPPTNPPTRIPSSTPKTGRGRVAPMPMPTSSPIMHPPMARRPASSRRCCHWAMAEATLTASALCPIARRRPRQFCRNPPPASARPPGRWRPPPSTAAGCPRRSRTVSHVRLGEGPRVRAANVRVVGHRLVLETMPSPWPSPSGRGDLPYSPRVGPRVSSLPSLRLPSCWSTFRSMQLLIESARPSPNRKLQTPPCSETEAADPQIAGYGGGAAGGRPRAAVAARPRLRRRASCSTPCPCCAGSSGCPTSSPGRSRPPASRPRRSCAPGRRSRPCGAMWLLRNSTPLLSTSIGFSMPLWQPA